MIILLSRGKTNPLRLNKEMSGVESVSESVSKLLQASPKELAMGGAAPLPPPADSFDTLLAMNNNKIDSHNASPMGTAH